MLKSDRCVKTGVYGITFLYSRKNSPLIFQQLLTSTDRSIPTDLYPLLTMHVLPWCGGVVLAIIVIIPCIIALCRKQCLQCYIKINREGVVAVSLDKKINLDRLLEGVEQGETVQENPVPLMNNDQPTPCDDSTAAGPPPGPMTDTPIAKPKCENWWNLWKTIFCCETTEEEKAKKKLSKLKSLLQKNRQNHTLLLQDCPPEEDKF